MRAGSERQVVVGSGGRAGVEGRSRRHLSSGRGGLATLVGGGTPFRTHLLNAPSVEVDVVTVVVLAALDVKLDVDLVAFGNAVQLVRLLLQGGELHIGGVLLCRGDHEFTLVELARLGLLNRVQALDRTLHLITHGANIARPFINRGCTRARSSTPRPHRPVQVGLSPRHRGPVRGRRHRLRVP